jgi:hypothetical protein
VNRLIYQKYQQLSSTMHSLYAESTKVTDSRLKSVFGQGSSILVASNSNLADIGATVQRDDISRRRPTTNDKPTEA